MAEVWPTLLRGEEKGGEVFDTSNYSTWRVMVPLNQNTATGTSVCKIEMNVELSLQLIQKSERKVTSLTWVFIHC